MFVVSTSSTAGGLPLEVVVTLGESTSTVNWVYDQIKSYFLNAVYMVKRTLITYSQMTHWQNVKDFKGHGLNQNCTCVFSTFYKACGDGYSYQAVTIK